MPSFLMFDLLSLLIMALVTADCDAQVIQQPPLVEITPRARIFGASAESDRGANIRVDTTLVPIPVAVTDPQSRYVTGLDKENFRIYEDKVEQEIAHLTSEDAPLSVGVVFDTSGSMGTKLPWSRQAVWQFIKIANPEDEFFLIEFADSPKFDHQIHSECGRNPKSTAFYSAQGQNGAARRSLSGDEPNEEGPQSPQGDSDYLRWRRQFQPLHRRGSEERSPRVRRAGLWHRYL